MILAYNMQMAFYFRREAIMNKISTFIMGASIGCAFGALAALALAPQSGAETRGLVAERAGSFAEDAQDFGAGVGYYAQGAAKDVRKKGEAVIKGNGKVEEGETVEELQAKIAAVREKLAATEA